MRSLKELALVPFLLASMAVASDAAPLPVETADNTNDLQRAAWACESGAPQLAQGSKTAGGGQARFFLGSVDGSANQRDKPPLTLQGDQLSGFGSLSDDRGWSNIRFDCTLGKNLRQATAFKFETLSPIPSGSSQPPPSSVAKASNSASMSWYLDGAGPSYLVHGVKETDDRNFFASCAKGSGEIKVTLTNTVKWLKDDTYLTVSISNGPSSGLYVAQGVMDENVGAFMPVFTISAKDPLPDWIEKGASLLVNLGSESVYEVSLKGSAQAAKAFAAACSR